MDNSTQPLFRQIASLVEDAIVDGTLGEGDRAPSTNELADFHNINPATARKVARQQWCTRSVSEWRCDTWPIASRLHKQAMPTTAAQ